MELHDLKPAKGSTKNRKRIGRGNASGKGGTAGRGHKGAQSRSGYKSKVGFEGGQMPIQRRVPKRGFKSRNRAAYETFNLGQVSELVEKYGLKEFSKDALYENKIIKKSDLVKILGDGELSAKIDFKVNAASAKAKEAIEKKGAKLEIL